jgi:hypothetical protein
VCLGGVRNPRAKTNWKGSIKMSMRYRCRPCDVGHYYAHRYVQDCTLGPWSLELWSPVPNNNIGIWAIVCRFMYAPTRNIAAVDDSPELEEYRVVSKWQMMYLQINRKTRLLSGNKTKR